jgi:similar to stage IV sporulation protein
VHVREREEPPTQTEKAPANLVAKKDGFVVSYTVKEGQPMVSAGQAVRAGELLVSGVVLHRGGSLSVVCAEGAVYARTTCSATVEIPLVQTVEEDAGRVVYDRALKIFGWEINFFKSTGNIDIECDTITENRQVSLPFGIRLPIWQSVTYTVARRTQEQTHTPAEAVRLATSMAQARVREEMGDAQVLTASTVVTQTANGYAVTYTVECLMDIATSREIGGGLEQG